MPDKPTLEELVDRLRGAGTHFGGELPNDVAAAWEGYFAALLEWGLISVEDHCRLVEILPEYWQGQNPVIGIFLGYGGETNDVPSREGQATPSPPPAL